MVERICRIPLFPSDLRPLSERSVADPFKHTKRNDIARCNLMNNKQHTLPPRRIRFSYTDRRIITITLFVFVTTILSYILLSPSTPTTKPTQQLLPPHTAPTTPVTRNIMTTQTVKQTQRILHSVMRFDKQFTAQQSSDGVGATVFRTIGTRSLDNLQPFLLLDEFHVKPPNGYVFHHHHRHPHVF